MLFKGKEETKQVEVPTQAEKPIVPAPAEKSYNYVLIVKYECGESGFLTNQPDLPNALKEYNDIRLKMLQDQSKSFTMPIILGAKLYRLFKEVH